MLDIGWTELLVIAIVLIVVVGPKDLPPMLRAFGKMTANLRRMAGEFRTQFDDALRESELDDVRKTIADAQSLNPANNIRDALNPLRQMGDEIKADLQRVTAPPVSAQPSSVAPPAPADIVPPEPAAPLPAAPVTPVTASPTVQPPVTVAAKPKAPRKPRAAAPAGEAGEAAPVKKAAPRRKKTTETGKDEA